MCRPVIFEVSRWARGQKWHQSSRYAINSNSNNNNSNGIIIINTIVNATFGSKHLFLRNFRRRRVHARAPGSFSDELEFRVVNERTCIVLPANQFNISSCFLSTISLMDIMPFASKERCTLITGVVTINNFLWYIVFNKCLPNCLPQLWTHGYDMYTPHQNLVFHGNLV